MHTMELLRALKVSLPRGTLFFCVGWCCRISTQVQQRTNLCDRIGRMSLLLLKTELSLIKILTETACEQPVLSCGGVGEAAERLVGGAAVERDVDVAGWPSRHNCRGTRCVCSLSHSLRLTSPKVSNPFTLGPEVAAVSPCQPGRAGVHVLAMSALML